MALLIRMLTWQSAMTGLGVTLGIIPFSIWVGRLQTKVRLHVVQKTDARVKLTGEVLSGNSQAVSAPFSFSLWQVYSSAVSGHMVVYTAISNVVSFLRCCRLSRRTDTPTCNRLLS